MLNVTKSNVTKSKSISQFAPMCLVDLLNPFVAIPAGDDFPETCLTAETTLQGSQIIHRESWRKLVEDGVIDSISDALVASINELTFKCLAKGLYLLFQSVLGHHQREVETSLRLLGATRQHVEDNTAAETDDGSTLTIGVLHVVNVFGCLYAFLLYPSLDGLAKSRGINESAERT